MVGDLRSVHVLRWASFLARRGHEVHVYSIAPAEQALSSVNVHLVPAPWAPKWVRMVAGAASLHRLIARLHPDVVHIQSVGAGAVLAAVVSARLLVVSPWGSEVASAAGHPLRRTITGVALRRASLVLTTSKAMASDVVNRFGAEPERVRVVSWGVEPDARSPLGPVERRRVRLSHGLPPEALVVLGIRSLGETYRSAELVRAFAAAKPPMHLVLLRGYIPRDAAAERRFERYRAEVLAITERLTPASWTFVDVPLNSASFWSLLGASDVAISIPRSDQRSTSVLEALGMGLSVVGSDIPAYRELVDDGFEMILLPEPIEPALVEWFHNPRIVTHSGRRRNVELIAATEDRAAGYAEIEAAIAETR